METITEQSSEQRQLLTEQSPSNTAPTLLSRVHRASGIVLAVFIAVHLGNHCAAFVSPEAHIHVMQALRTVYRNPLVETLLLAAVAVQVISGVRLVRRKGWKLLNRADRLQVASGLYLAFFLTVHTMAVFVGRLVLHVDTNFYFASSVVVMPYIQLYYMPYYALGVASVFVHLACVHRVKMQAFVSFERASGQAVIIGAVGIVLAVLLVAAFSGAFYEVRLPAEYRWF